jgi:hypothetical protein
MSRQIKMRLHCERTGKVLAYEVFNTILNYGYYWVDASEPEETRLCNTENYYHPSEPFSMPRRAQFTGLLDANGVEIYESDVVKVAGTGNCQVKICPSYGVVFMDGDGYERPYIDCVAENDHPEIIGNSYQHPELLK